MLYVGIDIGDGETAVAALDDYSVAPVTLPLGYPRHSILSAVGESYTARMNDAGVYENVMKYVIGDTVIQNNHVKNRSVRFKSRFLTDPASHDDLEHFALGLREALMQYSPVFAGAREMAVVVGCPTGACWTEEVRQQYMEVINRVLTLCDLPVGESRAAFLYTKYSVNAHVDPVLLDGNVLVIDIGSSTTDLAYIVNGREKKLNAFGSEHLGGGLIDRALLDACVSRCPNGQKLLAFLGKTPSVRARCEIRAREMKERYFTAQAQGQVGMVCRVFESLYYGVNHVDMASLCIEANDELINQVITEPLPELNGDTFTSALHQLLTKAKAVTSPAAPGLVILTGGASRMRFFQEAVARMFPQAKISCCEQPEFSIAEGLAFACRVDRRMQRFNSEISDYLSSPSFSQALSDHLPQLVDTLSARLAPRILSLSLNLPGDVRRGLKNNDTAAVKKARVMLQGDAGVQQIFRDTVNDWLSANMTDISNSLEEICQRYNVTTPLKVKVDPGKIRLTLTPMTMNGVLSFLVKLPLLGPALNLVISNFANKKAVAALRKEMSRPNGPFFADVRVSISDALLRELRQQVDAIQIPIL